MVPVITGGIAALFFGAEVEMFDQGLPHGALLFAIAPWPGYYSRYFIHETLFGLTKN